MMYWMLSKQKTKNKHMKYVKLFESFLYEVETAKTVKLDNSIKEKIKLAAELSAELKKLTDEYKKKIEPMQETLNKYDAEILTVLEGLSVSQAKVEDTIAKVMMQKGRMTDSYKTLWEEALKKVNDNTKKILLEMQAANKKKNPDKYWMEYTKESVSASELEGLNEGWKEIAKYGKEFLNKMKTWVSDVWSKIKTAAKSYFSSVDNLEKVAAKVTK